jgi:hypothetical protein
MAEREAGRERGGIDLRSLSKAYSIAACGSGLNAEREPSRVRRPRAISKTVHCHERCRLESDSSGASKSDGKASAPPSGRAFL